MAVHSEVVLPLDTIDVVLALLALEVVLNRDSIEGTSASLLEGPIVDPVVCIVLSLAVFSVVSCSDIVIPGTTT